MALSSEEERLQKEKLQYARNIVYNAKADYCAYQKQETPLGSGFLIPTEILIHKWKIARANTAVCSAKGKHKKAKCSLFGKSLLTGIIAPVAMGTSFSLFLVSMPFQLLYACCHSEFADEYAN